MINIFYILLCLFISYQNCALIKSNCLFHSQNRLFVLLDLKKSQPYEIRQDNKLILFNFCQPFIPEGCLTQKKHLAYIINEDTKICQPLTSQRSGQFTTIYSNYDFDDKNQLNILYGKDPQGFMIGKHVLNLELTCSQTQFQIISTTIYNWLVRIKIQSVHGCPIYQPPSLLYIIQEYEIVIFSFSLIVGLLFLFYGRVMISITSFLSMGITLTIISVLLCFKTMQKNVEAVYLYLIILVIIVCSFASSYYIARHYIKIPLFFIGALFGFIVLSAVKIVIVVMFLYPNVTKAMRYFVIIGMNIFGYFTVQYKDYAIICTSSVIGSYLIVRGASLIIGGFPSEFEIIELVESKMITSIPLSFYIYMLLMQIIAGIGAIYQQIKLLKERYGEGYGGSEMSQRTSFLSSAMSVTLEPKLDMIHNHIETLINRYNNRQSQVFRDLGPTQQKIDRQLDDYKIMFQKQQNQQK